jgi:hypothetical protein
MNPKSKKVARSGLVGCMALVAFLASCGGRPSYWNDAVKTDSVAYGLANGVALVDDADHRVVILTTPGSDLQVAEQWLRIGHGVVSVTVSPDATRLFVLSAGDWPRRTLKDEEPSMTVIDLPKDVFMATARRYDMSEPRGNLAVDPLGHWAAAYAGTSPSGVQATGVAAASFVQNPNEIVLFDLTPPSAVPPVTRTLQSFGGSPQRLVFTPELMLPNMTPRRLLLIETDIDLTMLDLDRAFDPSPPPEITVPLTSKTTSGQVTTAGVAVDGRNANDPNDARFAVWTSSDTNLYTMQLVAPTTDLRNDFAPTINVTDLGGVPSDVAWVETTDATSPTGLSLRVAALVPSTSTAILVDPDRSLTTPVTLPAPYQKLSLVTDLVAGAQASTQDTDVALLWGGQGGSSGVALWTLKNSVMQPYASIATLGATQPVSAALDVPAPNQRLKVLPMASGTGFYVLDLSAQNAPPLSTSLSATLSIAPDGGRLWAYQQGGTDLASVDFKTLNPIPVSTDLPIDSVFDIERQDFVAPMVHGRALIAVHNQGAIGITVFDALTPVTATSRRVAPLLLEGP